MKEAGALLPGTDIDCLSGCGLNVRRKRKCLVDLDVLIEGTTAPNSRSIEKVVHTTKLVPVGKMNNLPSISSSGNESKRNRVLPKKYDGFRVDKPPTWDCPGCNEIVNENGVVCSSCVAYWHFECAKVSEEFVKGLGIREFYCENHSLIAKNKVVEEASENIDSEKVTINVKIVPYVLNNRNLWANQLKNLTKKVKIDVKDNGNQYTIKVNTVTYMILIQKITTLGEKQGINIRRTDVDTVGQNVQAQFDLMITKGRVRNVPITITCYHTTHNMLIQAMGKKSDPNWNGKVDVLSTFVNETMKSMLDEIEKMKTYNEIKENIRNALCGKNEMEDEIQVRSNNTNSLIGISKMDNNLVSDSILNGSQVSRETPVDMSVLGPVNDSGVESRNPNITEYDMCYDDANMLNEMPDLHIKSIETISPCEDRNIQEGRPEDRPL